MAVELTAGEKVIYTRKYATGRRRSSGTVTVTDKRFVHVVESKNGANRTELKISEVHGAKVDFKPSSIILFIVGAIIGLANTALMLYNSLSNKAETVDGLMKDIFGMPYTSESMIMGLSPLLFCIFIFATSYSFIFLVFGSFKIRNGFRLAIFTPNTTNDMIYVSASTGKEKPLYLKTDRRSAVEILSELTSAVVKAKSYNKK